MALINKKVLEIVLLVPEQIQRRTFCEALKKENP